VFTSDNGGPVLGGDAVGSRNWPLRGGKHSIWEGGVRATAFVSGAGIAESQRGSSYTALMHGADWLPTLSEVAGYDLLHTLPLDGVSQWSGISRGVGGGSSGSRESRESRESSESSGSSETSESSESWSSQPRSSVVLGNATNLCSWPSGDPRRAKYTTVEANGSSKKPLQGCGFAIRDGNWKLIKGYGGAPDD